jgi:tetratricopeptide (TPR) repeat protein
MTTALELFKTAVQCHQNGQFQETERLCRQILAAEPNNAHALHLLGAAEHQRGAHQSAIEHLRQAVSLENNQVAFHSTLASTLLAAGRLDEGAAAMREVLRLRPDHVKTRNDLGVVLASGGHLDEAAECFRKVLEQRADYGPAHNNLGNVLDQQGKVGEAMNCFRDAVRTSPKLVQAHNNLANSLKTQGRIDEAIVQYRQGLQVDPNFAEIHYNLGLTLQSVGRLDEAREHFSRAVDLRPADPTFQVGLGSLLMDDGLLDDAMARFDAALRADPNCAPAEYFRATIHLARGQFEPGLAQYESRLRCANFMVHILPKPAWTGGPLEGRKLLIHAEQGLGDTLQFIRYVKQLPPLDGNVVVAVQEQLLPVLTASGFANLASAGEMPTDYDVQVPLLSLPRIFHTRLDTIPHDVPYLEPEPARAESWRRRLDQLPGFKIGIVWQGRPSARADRMRSIQLECFAPLAAAGARLIGLQKGPGSEQLAELNGKFDVLDLGRELDSDGAFLDTAAVMRGLDLVVTSDTAPAHLAGGLGVRVWVALSAAPEWRWLLDRDDSPWYPTMRLFRQDRRRDWDTVFEAMARELAPEIERRAGRAVN